MCFAETFEYYTTMSFQVLQYFYIEFCCCAVNLIIIVKAYKVYAEKRPAEMKTDDAPSYLAVSVKSVSCKPWFKKAPVGVNKLNTLMETMAQKDRLRPNFKNHSGRKTMIQTLVNNNVPPTNIMQLSGHKNI